MKNFLLALSAFAIFGSASGTAASTGQKCLPIFSAQDAISIPSDFNIKSDSPFHVSTRADEELELKWGYSADPATAFAFPAGELRGAVMMTAEETSELAGATIDKLILGTPALSQQNYPNPLRDVTIWISESLDGEPIVQTAGKLSRNGLRWSFVPLSTPYTIEGGKDIYIGYTLELPSTQNFYGLVTDNTPNYENEHSAYLYSTLTGFSNQGQLQFGDTYEWKAVGQYFGNLCIRAVLHGDMLPTDRAEARDMSLPIAVRPGDPFNTSVYVINTGANTANDVDITMEIKGQEPQTVNVSFGKNALSCLDYNICTAEFVCENEGCLDFELYISAVNGTPVEKLNPYTSTLLSLSEGYDRNVVIEEATGTWCGWCVVGYAGMEYMKEKYSNDGFLGIAIHQGDDMSSLDQGGAYQNYYNYISGFPSAFCSRNWADNIYPAPENLEATFLNMRSFPSPVKVVAELKNQSDSDKTVTLSAKTTFSLDLADQNYGLAYTVVEDNVGPYPQQNYTTGRGDYYGFENKPSVVVLSFNDVARNCSRPDVIKESVITSPTKGKEHEYTTQIKLSDVDNLENYRVIVMVIDTKTGLIQNATQAINTTNGVLDVIDGTQVLKAIGGNGVLSVSSEAPATVYTADGRVVASGVHASDIDVPAGVYIVNANGKSVKVLVF